MEANLYAKYYFELRALFKDNEKEFPLKPLSKKKAKELEINSTLFQTCTDKNTAQERLNESFWEYIDTHKHTFEDTHRTNPIYKFNHTISLFKTSNKKTKSTHFSIHMQLPHI